LADPSATIGPLAIRAVTRFVLQGEFMIEAATFHLLDGTGGSVVCGKQFLNAIQKAQRVLAQLPKLI